MRMRTAGSVALTATMTCVGLAAEDKWDAAGDDGTYSYNQLLHGAVQTHDLQGTSTVTTPSDLDFSFVAAQARHSYEVRVFNASACFVPGVPGTCARLDRVSDDGLTVVTPGFAPDGGGPPLAGVPGWMAVRWTPGVDQFDFIRVYGPIGAGEVDTRIQYDIQLLDTTYLVPRWNNSGTQVTIFLIQNGSTDPVNGNVFFYNAAGALLATQSLSLAANGLQAISTAAIVELAGASGTAAITHDGGYGALSGKAVALEPATGFAFDTQITPILH